ncbi:alpha/beta hydrolase [uncultured Tateyamaria sp.]|uniref:alpha/beta fold hydrolase n=1 Tax=uncultured Tateyamaria sp. TaxID=455651 RepID=UPI002620621D|nr:alpha/beta hydrolase [uncultured Tateyamaria sp.]
MTWTTRPRSEVSGLPAIVAGQEVDVLMLHGVGLCADAWAPQIDALARYGYGVMAPDMPGHGGSDAAPGADLSDYVRPLAAALEGPVVVIGHSMGAMIALALAEVAPDKVVGVVAMNAIFQRSPEAAAAVQARASALDGVSLPDPEPTLHRWFGDADTPACRACDGWLRGVHPAAYKSAYTIFASEDGPSPELLATLDCPALFVTGAEEPNSTPAMSEAMARHAPKGSAMVIDGAAHMLPMTHHIVISDILCGFAARCLP